MNNNRREEIYISLTLQFNKFTRDWRAKDSRHGELDGILYELSEKLARAEGAEGVPASLPAAIDTAADNAALLSVVRELNFQRRKLQLPAAAQTDAPILAGYLAKLALPHSPAMIYRTAVAIAASLIRLASETAKVKA